MVKELEKRRVLLGPDGLPLDMSRINGNSNGVHAKSLFSSVNTYITNLQRSHAPAKLRAMDPFSNHSWVFAAAMVTSMVASQAEYVVFRETDAQLRTRVKSAADAGRKWTGAKSGHQRRAMMRHDVKRWAKRVMRKGIMVDFDHPIMDLFQDPNPFLSKEQLFQLTYLWLAVRGEIFWVLTDDEGGSTFPGAATRIWPIGPDCFEPWYSKGDHGDLLGWYYRPPRWMPNSNAGIRIQLDLSEVVQFKFANPLDPVRGMSRLTAVALGIETDLMVQAHNRSLLANSGVPKGVITSKEPLSSDEEQAYLAKWKDKHEGVNNAARIALLSGGFEYDSIALTPEDMDFIESRKMNREEVLAVMGVPPSVVGVTDFVNYATQLGQDKNFWDKNILPTQNLIETALDKSVFFEETDSVFGGFDLSSVEALRAGLTEKVAIATQLASDKLHVPPRVAFEVVDLEVPEYEGDHVALVAGFSMPAKDVVNPPAPEQTGVPGDPTESPAVDDEEDLEEDPEEEEEDEDEEDVAVAAARGPWVRRSSAQRKASSGRRWRQFASLETVLETAMKKAYRSWVAQVQRETMARFDQSAKSFRRRITKDVNLSVILPDLFETSNQLKAKSRPTMTGTMQETYNFTLDDIGIPTFEIDDPRLMNYFDLREKKFIDSTPKTLIDNLRRTMTQGVQAGESISQLRARISQVFNISSSSAKALQIARTETANLMNGVRDQMFGAQGFSTQEWVSAGDEATRPDHILFGDEGPKDRGFNYLTLPGLVNGTGGALQYPGDLSAPPGQVINCRCMMIPTE